VVVVWVLIPGYLLFSTVVWPFTYKLGVLRKSCLYCCNDLAEGFLQGHQLPVQFISPCTGVHACVRVGGPGGGGELTWLRFMGSGMKQLCALEVQLLLFFQSAHSCMILDYIH
jgi:hypothetical protein